MKIKVTADRAFLQELPDLPGVYRYYDKDDAILYVGKAINLKKRVKSYFQRSHALSPRISIMVSKIVTIEVTTTNNETSALLLESNLIKTLKPRYNIIFRDDKSYPFIRVNTHDFPLIEYYRGGKSGDDRLFGPYPNSYAVRETLDLLQRLFKLRTCKDSEFDSKTRPCMLYQVNLCCAPCVGYVSQSEYRDYVNYARKFLSGDYADLVNQLSSQMYVAAEKLDFEIAGSLRDKIALIRNMQDKQIISDSLLPINADLVLVQATDVYLYVYIIIIRNGLYVGDKHFHFAKYISDNDILEGFLEEYYKNGNNITIYIDFTLSAEFVTYCQKHLALNLHNEFPGRIAELRKMGYANLKQAIENDHIDNIYLRASQQIARLLNLAELSRIECYDTSHNHGVSAVASMVVYANGKIDHKLYRRYNLAESVNGNDLLALETVLRRRLQNQEIDLPDVILVDGGHLQLNITKNIIDELGFRDKIKVIAIYKGENRNPELDKVIINEDLELNFRKEPQIFRLLQALRDEAHRFAIAGHRKKQVDRMTYSKLQDIPGIGAAKRKALIAFFGSANNVATATIDELCQVDGIGAELASTVYNFFNS